MYQYALNLKNDFSYLAEDFIESSSNFMATKWINSWPNWQGTIFSNIACIYGPKNSGKTHLAHIWQTKSAADLITLKDIEYFLYHNNKSGYLIDDIEQFLVNEKALLLFLNYVIENKKYLLITSRCKPHNLPITIPDLRSRIQSFIAHEIMPPDEELIGHMLVKSFSDQQIMVNEEVIKYITNRIDRNYETVKLTVDLLNKASLSQHKKITIPLVKAILQPD